MPNLKPETGGQDKGPDAADKSGEEGVEGEGADEATVEELHHPGEEDVNHVGIDQLQTLGGVVKVPAGKHRSTNF